MRSCSLALSCSRSRAAFTNMTSTDDETLVMHLRSCLPGKSIRQCKRPPTGAAIFNTSIHYPTALPAAAAAGCHLTPCRLTVKTQAPTRLAAHLLLQQGDVGLHAVPAVRKARVLPLELAQARVSLAQLDLELTDLLLLVEDLRKAE